MSEVKDAEVWLIEFDDANPGIFVDLNEDEREAVCEWICTIQNQAIVADRERR